MIENKHKTETETETETTALTNGLIDITLIEDELRPQSSDQLRLEQLNCYHGTAYLLARSAICVKLLEERGESTAGLKNLGLFRRIADKQVLPELVCQFIQSPNLRVVTGLPLHDQKRLARDPMVPVIEMNEDGTHTKRMVDLGTASKDLLGLAVSQDGVRNIEEQAAYLGAKKTATRCKAASRPEKETPAEPLTCQITVKLTPGEMKTLKILAAQAGIPVCDQARRLMIQSGKLN